MEISDNESQHSENSNDMDWVTDSSNSNASSDDEDSVESIFESKAEREHIFSLFELMDRTRLHCGQEFLDKLIKSNDPKDKETLNSTIIKILKSDYDADLQYLISNLTLDLNAKDYEDMTALSLAASFVSIEVVKLLLKNMTDSDVERYNQENLLTLGAINLLPDLWEVEQTLAIIDLIQDKNIQLNLKNKMIVLYFFVHDIDECECKDIDISISDLRSNMETLISYGSSMHIENVIHKIRNDISSGNLKLDIDDFYLYISAPLSPGVLLDIYVDKDVQNLIEDLCGTCIEDGFPFKFHHDLEWKWMKKIKLQNNLNLQELLKKHPYDIYEFVKNLDFFKLGKKFQFAGEYMKGLKAKSLIRHQVLEFIPDFVRVLLPPLPDLCFDRIMFYITGLSNEDLLNMCKAIVMKKDAKN